MEGLTGSYAKLRNTDIPLQERLEVARKIVSNNECFLPNKSQVIVDLLSQELGSRGRKRDKDGLKVDELDTEMWKILSEVFNDPVSDQIVLRQKILPLFFRELDEIKSYLGQNGAIGILNKITEDRILSVFSCFQAISKNPNMSLTFFNKFENLEQYVKGILTCFFTVLLKPDLHSAKFVEELFQLIVIVLRQYGTAQQQQVSQHKVFKSLCEKLLPLLLLVRTVMKNETVFDSDDICQDDFGSIMDDVIISGLFHRDIVLNYNPTAMPRQQAEPSPKKPKLVNSYNQLFDVLEGFAKGTVVNDLNVSSDLIHQTIHTSLPFLLENFLKATQDDEKLDRASKFSFFIELYNVIASNTVDKQLPEVTRIEILNKMLNVIVDYDVYQIAEDNVNDQLVFKWFQKLMESELLSQTFDNAVTFQCLDIIFKLNHKIIEVSLEIVLAKCFAKSQECSKAKIDLLCNIVQTYAKLQQIGNLVACLLKVFNKLGSKLGSIPVDVLTKLSKSFKQCPFNQTLGIAQVFLNAMKEKVQLIQQDGNTDLSIKGVSILFVTFLGNSSYNAADTHSLDEKKVTQLMKLVEDIKVSIIAPLIGAFPSCRKTCQEEVGFSAMHLIYGLNNLVLFLHQHDVIPESEDHYVKMFWDSKVDGYIPNETWKGLAILKKNGCLKFCVELLVVHRMRCLLLKPDLDQKEFDHLMNFLFNFQDPQTIAELSSVSWNFDPSYVNTTNYSVAHWSLVTQYASVFIPYSNENQLQAFAEFMVGTMVLQEDESSPDNLATLRRVSENILKGELFSLSSLQAAIVKQLCKLLGECMKDVVGENLLAVFNWEVEDQIAEVQNGTHEHGDTDSQHGKIDMNKAISLAQMIAKVVNAAVDKSATKRSKKTSIGELSTVSHLLKVLQRLHCHRFSQGNQVHCILGSLACDVLLGKLAPDNQALTIQLTCRQIVTTILQGSLQHREFSAWRVVDMASLLRWLHHTILRESQTSAKISPKFLDVSKELLRFAVLLSLKSSNRASATAIVDFNQQLVTSLTKSVKNASSKVILCVDVLFNLVSACTEFLDQKGKNKSSLQTACSIISDTMVSLTSFTKSILLNNASYNQNDESYVELEEMVMKLSGILTRAMSLIPETELPKTEAFTKAFEGWSEIVSMIVAKILRKMEDADFVGDEITTYISILEDVFKGAAEHSAAISDEFRTQILRKCLEVLRKIGFPFAGDGPNEWSKLQEAVIRLIVGSLEEDEGRNCIGVLESILEWSVEADEASKDSFLNLFTGLSVFRDLLATKVVKQNKKELRPRAGKIMVTLLSRAAISVEITCVVLESVAALTTLGSGVFYPQDLTFVFHPLAFDLEVTDIGVFSRIFMARFAILSWTLFYYPEYVYGAVHVFLPYVRKLLHSLLIESGKISNGKMNSEQVSIFSSCVQKMSRLYQEMVSHKDVLSKYSVYFLGDCVHVMSTQGVPGIIRDVLVQGVHFLFDICNDESLTKLHVYLSSTERELFRSLKEDYTKHHKFKGNA